MRQSKTNVAGSFFCKMNLTMLHKTTKPDLKTSQVISMIQSDIALANKKPLVEVFYQR